MPDNLPRIPNVRFEAYPALPFDSFQLPLDELLIAMANLIEREWPRRYSENQDLKMFLLGTVKIVQTTYNSIRYLAADLPANSDRKLEFAISIPPLARTVLDSLFTIIFIFNDPQARIVWYHKSGWREFFEEHERYKATYSSDPKWADYLSWQETLVNYTRREWGITEEEANNPRRNISWWPNPGKMISDPDTSEERRVYLRYLNDWFYRSLSADSHLSWPGFARRSAFFLNQDEENRINLLKKYKSDAVMTTIALILSLLSEIESEFHFSRAERLKYIWNIISGFSGEAKELYELRYVNRL